MHIANLFIFVFAALFNAISYGSDRKMIIPRLPLSGIVLVDSSELETDLRLKDIDAARRNHSRPAPVVAAKPAARSALGSAGACIISSSHAKNLYAWLEESNLKKI